jgi:hypothetical protein
VAGKQISYIIFCIICFVNQKHVRIALVILYFSLDLPVEWKVDSYPYYFMSKEEGAVKGFLSE